ncbi:hypothetical protein HYW76_02405 [Candidatus Pacearchaeota archaeon]|nr:hypothetical protein [Candidatus Pacearchaeota archaeon]
MEGLSSFEVFESFLSCCSERGVNQLGRYDRLMHRAFGFITEEHPEQMGAFCPILKRAEMYCHVLETLLHLYSTKFGILSFPDEHNRVEIDKSSLERAMKSDSKLSEDSKKFGRLIFDRFVEYHSC